MNQEQTNNEKAPENLTSPKTTDQDKSKKRRDFWYGVGLLIGLIILMVIVLFVSSNVSEYGTTSHEKSIFFSNFQEFFPYYFSAGIVILIIFLAFKRPRIALGMLASIGCSFALSIAVFIIMLLSGECFGMC